MLYMVNGSLEYNFVEILNDGHCCEFCYYSIRPLNPIFPKSPGFTPSLPALPIALFMPCPVNPVIFRLFAIWMLDLAAPPGVTSIAA